MKARFAIGLVVGKFCPLHQGHQHLINHALRACDRLIVVSYSQPQFDRCQRANRDRWIAELFPTVTRLVIDDTSLAELCRAKGLTVRALPANDAPDDEHRCFVAWLCCSLLETAVDAVFTSEHYGDGFAAALTNYFHAHCARPRPVQHQCVDLAREQIPIRGTDARSDPYRNRHFLAPVVFADLIQRVAILGGESSGKTTLAQSLASHLAAEWVPEFGRELWQRQNGELRQDDMLKIGRTQVANELQIGHRTRHWLFCDTTPLTTAFYSQEMFGRVDAELARLASREYDHYVLCGPDFPFVQDGTRQGAPFRDRQHAWYLRELNARKVAFFVATGTVVERLAAVASWLEAGLQQDRPDKVAQTIDRSSPNNHHSIGAIATRTRRRWPGSKFMRDM